MMPQPLGGGRGFREVGSPPHMPTQVLFFNGNKVYSKAHPVCCVRACGPQANCPQTPFAQASRVPLLPRAVLAVWEHLDSRTLKGRRPLGALDLAPRRTEALPDGCRWALPPAALSMHAQPKVPSWASFPQLSEEEVSWADNGDSGGGNR